MMCLNPFELKDPEGVRVPCGKCPPCLKRRASGWAFRLAVHERNAISAHFVTLTYDNSHVPRTPRGYNSLRVRDVQLYFKRLRKYVRKHSPNQLEKVSYYVAGEYGSRNNRPHWHAIIFNASEKSIVSAWREPSHKHKTGRPLGFVHVGTVTGASVGYTLKYMCKPKTVPRHGNDDRLPERSLMSKGLGADYLSPSMIKWHYDDIAARVYCTDNGRKISMPRYYRNKLYDAETKENIIAPAMVARLSEKMEKIFFDDFKGDLVKYQYYMEQRKNADYTKMYRNSQKDRDVLTQF